MKKGFLIYGILIGVFSLNAQEKKKDTLVATEIVNVVTKYNPKIADAQKIKNNPKIILLEKSNKKKLTYTIFSAAVASTFIPKTGVVKGINVGTKERVFDNYIAAGYGNYASPYAELFLYKNNPLNNEFGLHVKYDASEEPLENTVLNSNFLNFNMATFFKQEERYFDWKVSASAARNNYNWYGLPKDNALTENAVNSINEAQNYRYLELVGNFKFHDSYIDFGEVVISSFADKFKSAEIRVNFNAKLAVPLDFLNSSLNDLSIHSGLEFLKGSFQNNYENSKGINYNLITAKLIPEYTLEYQGVSIKVSLKTFVSLDTEHAITNFFMFPDVLLRTSILKKYINGYVGFTGDLETNTYKKFTEVNPYVSPTLFITQTATSSNFFIGFKGNITRNLNYNIKASIKEEEDKPLFLRNNSKVNGTTVAANSQPLKGYEYGNSFGVYYDDVKSTSVFAEIEYIFDKNISFTTHLKYDNYTTTTALENWNLPSLQGAISAKYVTEKWYATSNIYYVGERKDAVYTNAYPSRFNGVENLNSFIDVNLNGGYHFNDKFSTFLKLNNVLNTTYQRFVNFNTQGFQALAGFTYKFDF